MKDIQNLKDNRNVDIQRVGIKHLELPLIIQRKIAQIKLFVQKQRLVYHCQEITKELTCQDL